MKLIEAARTLVERKDPLKPLAFFRWLDQRAEVTSNAQEALRAEHDPARVQIWIVTSWNQGPVKVF